MQLNFKKYFHSLATTILLHTVMRLVTTRKSKFKIYFKSITRLDTTCERTNYEVLEVFTITLNVGRPMSSIDVKKAFDGPHDLLLYVYFLCHLNRF